MHDPIVFHGHEPNYRLAHSRRMRIEVDPLVVEPIVDHCRLAFEQEDSCRAPPMADKMRDIGRLPCLGIEREDHKGISILVV